MQGTGFRVWLVLAVKLPSGLSYGFTAWLLYQSSNREGLSGDDDAFGGIYRFQGNWTAFGRGTGHPGSLEWRLEYRWRMGSFPEPQTFGRDLGIAALNTGFPYGRFDFDVSMLNWTQLLAGERAGFAIGRLIFDNYQDMGYFQSISRGFLNRAFIINPTIALTGFGALGVAAKALVTDHIWVGCAIFDGNAVNGEFELDTLRQWEFLKNVEIGWKISPERADIDQIQLTFWHKDALDTKGVPSGRGLALTASHQFHENLIAFLRWGHSDGGGGVRARNAVGTGFEYKPWPSQAWSFGFGWAGPAQSGLRDEYVLETSYQLQLTPQLSVMPDVQLILDPAANPSESNIWVFSVRAILAF